MSVPEKTSGRVGLKITVRVGVMVGVRVTVRLRVRLRVRVSVWVTLRSCSLPEATQKKLHSSVQDVRVMVRQPSPSAAGRMDSAHLRIYEIFCS